MPRIHRRRLPALALAAGLFGCSTGPAAAPASPPVPAAGTTGGLVPPPRPAPGQLAGVLPSTDLAVGRAQRFLLGLLDDRNRPVLDAKVQLRFFKLLNESTAQLRSEVLAPFRGSPQLGDRGLYVARVDFDEPGNWGVEVQASRPTAQPPVLRLSFNVQAQSQTPALGSPAPASQTPTAVNPAAGESICSARPVCPFHQHSVAEALRQGKPLALLFATPGFCATRTCGPDLDILQAASAGLTDRLTIVHVEIYEGAQPPNLVEAIRQWRLPSEPWLFLIDRGGSIVEKFEGGITLDELQPALSQLLGG